MTDTHSTNADFSPSFYRRKARRYAQVAHDYLQSVYIDASVSGLTDDLVLLTRAKGLSPGNRSLDAGCGAGARDVFTLWSDGWDAYGVDAIPENIEVAREWHAEIADRVSVADISQPLAFDDESFDLVLCNAVIQHIPHRLTLYVTLPEFVRVLRPGGILQLMFKHGKGTLTLFDPDYGERRAFLLYNEREILSMLSGLGMELVEVDNSTGLGGIMYLTDTKGAAHCAFHARKRG